MDNTGEQERRGPEGTSVLRGPCGTQLRRSRGRRWSDKAETIFLDQLAATCNVALACEACGFSHAAIYRRRRRDPVFRQRWEAALAQGYAHLEALLLRRAVGALEGFAPDPDAAVRIPEFTARDALAVLGHHRRSVGGGPRSRREWARPRSLDEVRDSILAKLAAVAPASFETGPQATPSAPPQDERDNQDSVRPEERGRTAQRLEGP